MRVNLRDEEERRSAHHEQLNSAPGERREDLHKTTPMTSVLGRNLEDQLHHELLNWDKALKISQGPPCTTKNWNVDGLLGTMLLKL